jgi:hypothetical protein
MKTSAQGESLPPLNNKRMAHSVNLEFCINLAVCDKPFKIPPHLPLPKGGETFPPFDKGGVRGIRQPFSKS